MTRCLLPLLLLLISLPANAQSMREAPQYRLTTKWKMVFLSASGQWVDSLWVEVIKDTTAFGRDCWLMMHYPAGKPVDTTVVPSMFLMRKSDANMVAMKSKYAVVWEEVNMRVLKFPMKAGMIFSRSFTPDLNNRGLIAEYDKIRCKVSGRGEWELAPKLPDGSKPATWTLNCIAGDNHETRVLFPVHFMEPDEALGFPGSCPLQLHYEVLTGILVPEASHNLYPTYIITEWQW